MVVVRDDVHSNSATAKKIALFDNRAGELGLDWDPVVIGSLCEELDLQDWFSRDELARILGEDFAPLAEDTDASSTERRSCGRSGRRPVGRPGRSRAARPPAPATGSCAGTPRIAETCSVSSSPTARCGSGATPLLVWSIPA
ncbi:MAG TPA: hypothetical protein VKI41_19120, partial [Vicinamibacteria bacterium]|nr:hypothetical protein [Vicinamibacteria bacterium]